MPLRQRTRRLAGAKSTDEHHSTTMDLPKFEPSTLRCSSLHAHPKFADILVTATNDHPFLPNCDFGSSQSTSVQRRLPLLQPQQPDYVRDTRDLTKQSQARVTSEGTAIIHRRDLGQLNRTSETTDTLSSIGGHEAKAKQKTDEQGEIRADIRKRSNMRMVSKEDYLLGRGANPRTGLITPGSNSMENSVDEEQLLKDRNISLPAKWRQKGDQWVCTDNDHVTPSFTPTRQVNSNLDGRLQVPQRLGREYGRETDYSHAKNEHRDSEADFLFSESSMALPGVFPVTPLPQLPDCPSPQLPATYEAVRRKPVGSSNTNLSSFTNTTKQHILGAQPTFSSNRQTIGSEVRSSSAPTPRKVESGVIDTKSSLPDKQQHISRSRMSSAQDVPNVSFLGPAQSSPVLQGRMLGRGKTDTMLQVDKELPCLPMSSGQSPSHPSIQSRRNEIMHSKQRDTGRTRNALGQKLHGPRGVTPDHLYHQSRRFRIMNQRDRSTEEDSQWTKTDHGVDVIPSYDNPPREPLLIPTRTHVEGPRMMPLTSQGPATKQADGTEIQDPFTTTFMNTSIFTPVRKDPKTRLAQPNNGLDLIWPTPPHSGRRTITRTVTSSNSMGQSIPSSTSRVRPREAVRPTMPNRSMGWHNVPKLGEPSKVAKRTITDNQQLSNMTGTQGHRTNRGKDENQSLQTNVNIHPDFRSFVPDPYTIQRQIDAHEQEKKDVMREETQKAATDLTRRCSRCNNGFVADKLRNTAGLMDEKQSRKLSIGANAPEAVPSSRSLSSTTEVDDQRSSQTNVINGHSKATDTSPIVESLDSGEHKDCCSECCKMDCHEGCLGHRSSLSSPTRSTQGSISEYSSPPTSIIPTSESDTNSPGKERSTKIGTLSNISHNFKRTMRNDMTSRKPSPTKCLSPASFWGGNGASSVEGAACAAKKAIESGNMVSAQAPGQLQVSKRRPNKAQNLRGKLEEKMSPGEAPEQLQTTEIQLNQESACRMLNVTIGAKEHDMSNVIYVRKTTPLATWTTTFTTKNRSISGTSIETIHLPQFSGQSLGTIWELLLIPLDAAQMWLRNNPQVKSVGWQSLERVWEMMSLVRVTARSMFSMAYVYSKTGKLRTGKGVTSVELARDCVKSILYLMILAISTVVLVRIVRLILLPLQMVMLVGKTVLAMTGKIVKIVW